MTFDKGILRCYKTEDEEHKGEQSKVTYDLGDVTEIKVTKKGLIKPVHQITVKRKENASVKLVSFLLKIFV